jgi:hypothetical protein
MKKLRCHYGDIAVIINDEPGREANLAGRRSPLRGAIGLARQLSSCGANRLRTAATNR